MTVSLRRIGVVVASGLYVPVLIWSYASVVSPNFSYMGYTLDRPALLSTVGAWSLATTPSLWLPIALKKPSHVVCWMLYVIAFVPALIIPLYSLDVRLSRLIGLELSILASFAALSAFSYVRPIHISRPRLEPNHFWALVYAASGILYFYIFRHLGFQLNTPSLDNIYDVRYEYRDELAVSGSLVAYAVHWQANVFNPLIISKGLIDRRPVMMVLGIGGQLILFSLTGFRVVFFSGLLVLALLFALRGEGRNFGLNMAFGSAAFVVVVTLVDLLRGSILLSSIFMRRLIVTPGLLTGYYYEFFSDHPKALLTHSVVGQIFDNPYDLSPPFLIGYYYFGNERLSANANVWADGFANFGYAGVLAFGILLGLTLWVLDSLAAGRDFRLTSLLIGIPAFSLSNTALLTTFVTHGMGLVLVIMYCMPSATSEYAGENSDANRSQPGRGSSHGRPHEGSPSHVGSPAGRHAHFP